MKIRQSNVVYHLKCKNCNDNYVGMTTRICDIRMKEHNTIDTSHVYQRNIFDGHEIDFEGVEILDTASTALKLQYKEMLYIRKLKPTLNKQVESELFCLIIQNVQLTDGHKRYSKISEKRKY